MERHRSGGFNLTPDELKHKESRLEGNSMKMKKDNEREIQQKLDALTESIKWYEPRNLKLDDVVELGKMSNERREHDQRINGKLPSMYAKEYQIPDTPSFDNILNNSKLFDRPATIPLCNAEGEEEISASVKNLEEKRAVKKIESKNAKPLKSILKKKKKEASEEEEEAEKNKLLAKKKLNIEPEIVLRLFSGEHTQEEQELFSKALKESGRQSDIVKNIETLKKFLENVQKIKASEKAQIPIPEPRKAVKTNEEPEVNMLRQIQDDPFYQQQMQLQQNYNQMQDLQDSGSPGDGTKKVSYKPHNYKTVPCVFFHSPQGCSRSDNCHFIHDWNYSGRETPNMRKYVRNNLITKPGENPMIPPMGSTRTGSDIPLERPQTTYQGLNTTNLGGGGHFFQQQHQTNQHHQIQQQHQHQQHHQQQQHHHQQGHFDHHNPRQGFNQGNQRQQHNNFGGNQRQMNNQFGGQMGRPQQQPPMRNDMMFPGGGPPMHNQYQHPNFFQQQQPFHPQHPQGNMHMGGGNMQNRHMMNQQQQQHGNYGN